MRPLERTRGGPVPEASPQPRQGGGGVLVADLDTRLVPDAPAGFDQAPDEVHVLSVAEPLVVAVAQRIPAEHHRRRGDERHRAAGADRRRARAQVQGGGAVPRCFGHDPRRDAHDQRVDEVPRQAVDPPATGEAVAVAEGDQLRGDRPEPGVAGRGRAARDRPSDDVRAVEVADRCHRVRVGRPVVDDDDPMAAPERRQAVGQLQRTVADRDDDRHVDRRAPRAGAGDRHAVVGEPAGQPGGRRVADGTGLERGDQRSAAPAEAQQPWGRPAEQDGRGRPLHAGGEVHPHPVRERLVGSATEPRGSDHPAAALPGRTGVRARAHRRRAPPRR